MDRCEFALGLRPTHSDESALLSFIDSKRVTCDFRRSAMIHNNVGSRALAWLALTKVYSGTGADIVTVDSVRHLSPGEQRIGTCRDDRMVSDLHPRCYDPIHVTAKA